MASFCVVLRLGYASSVHRVARRPFDNWPTGTFSNMLVNLMYQYYDFENLLLHFAKSLVSESRPFQSPRTAGVMRAAVFGFELCREGKQALVLCACSRLYAAT